VSDNLTNLPASRPPRVPEAPAAVSVPNGANDVRFIQGAGRSFGSIEEMLQYHGIPIAPTEYQPRLEQPGGGR